MGRLPDTIAALATPPGRGGVGIVRVSGPLVTTIAQQMLSRLPIPRHADYLPFHDATGAPIDAGIALYFPAPHSFTGEDVLELQGHSGPLVTDMLLKATVALGARLARPGEFSERAFLNNKIDLVQAEAIADLIDSVSEQAARAANRSLQGEFSGRINALIEQLIALRVYVESAIDFPEEELDFLSDTKLDTSLAAISDGLNAVLRVARQGNLLREGMNIVIAGCPNVGKSSLLNSLTGRAAAIVTDIPGTTRDVLREHIHIDGMPLHIIDTAGLRESADQIEQEGMRRAWHEIAHADRVLLVTEQQEGLGAGERTIIEQLPDRLALTVVHNKIDLTERGPTLIEVSSDLPASPQSGFSELWLSVKTGAGMDLLRGHLKDCMGYQGAGEGSFTARRRHLDALAGAQASLERARVQLQGQRAGELLADDLLQAQNALSEITGAFTTEDLLGRIFSSFCIGK